MDKILRRTRMVERQVERRAKKLRKLEWTSRVKWDRIRQRKELRKEVGEQLRQAVIARHQDWEMGPLAPRRDTSRHIYNDIYWGTISTGRVKPDIEMTQAEREARCAWAGGAQHLCLAVGDRVVVTEGSWQNQIGEVEEIKLDSATLTLKPHFMVSPPMIHSWMLIRL